MVKRVDYEKRRLEILHTAMSLFAEQGYEQCSLLEIADGCGMRLTCLYQYFQDKEEMIQCMMKHLVLQISDEVRMICLEAVSPVEKLKKLVSKLGEEFAKEENRVLVLVELQKSVDLGQNQFLAKLNHYSQYLRQVFWEILEEGQATGQIYTLDSESMAFALSVLIESFVLQIVYNRKFSVQGHLVDLYRFLDGLQS